jgi:3-hydroxyacyl-[acyl-carrier-protein] dehydratase
MKFQLIDKIISLQPGESIETLKTLSLAEEYLADHFPSFPILPGVLMIEALTQSAAWLVRLEQDYANSIVVLKTVRNARYNYFLRPGNTLRCEVSVKKMEEQGASFMAAGYVGETQAVSARLDLMWRNVAGAGATQSHADQRIIEQLKETFALIGGPEALAGAEASQTSSL